MIAEDFSALNISRYQLRLKACRAVALPRFLGSTLRGAFGHALKETVCVMKHRDCERCLVADRCIYPYVFETPVPAGVRLLRGQKQAPHPFILTPPHAQLTAQTQRETPYQSAAEKPRSRHLTDGRMVRLVQSRATATDGRRHLKIGDELTFGLLLMGRAVEYMPYIVYAVSEMGHRGLGADRGRFQLSEVALRDERGGRKIIYTGATERIAAPVGATKSLSDLVRSRLDELATSTTIQSGGLRLKFLTPSRIRVEGDLQSESSFDLLARNLLRRVSMLAVVHGSSALELDFRGLIERAASVRTSSLQLHWWDWERYSNRQRTKLNMGGFVGEIEYAGEAIKEFLPLLVAGEILHVGSGTSFGLGRYEIAG